MGTALQTTEEMRGMSSVPSAQELQSLYNYQKYLSNNLKLENNNINFYRSQRLSNYTPDDIRRGEIQEGFGSSKYDYRIPDIAMAYGDLTDFRAAQQGPFLEALASLGQFGTRAVGTVAEGVSLPFGMLIGGIKHAVDYLENDPTRPEEEKHNFLYDIIFNPISQGINKAQDALIESMPFYKTTEELNNSWWTNVVHHPFTWFFADALPSMGFTVGAMVGGKIHGNMVDSLLGKALGKKEIIKRAANLGVALEEIPDEKIPELITALKNNNAAQKLDIINKYLKNERVKNSISNWAGILNASATEATVEGYNTRKEYIDEVLPKAYDYMKSEYFQNQLHDNFQNDNEGFEDFEDYRAEKEREIIQNIVKTADNIGLTTYGANVAFLTAHNKFFWDSFFNPKFLLKNSVRDYTKLFKVTGKDGLVTDVALKNSFWMDHPRLGRAAFAAKNGLAEAFEEMSQGLFSESSKEGYGSKMNDMFFSDYQALLDPRYSQEKTGFWGAVDKGLQETYLNPERWEEGMIGFLTGLVGLPTVGMHQKGSRQGKKGITGWTFGGAEEWKAYQDRYKQAEKLAKQFRSNEGNERDAYMSVKDYLTGEESSEMRKLNALGKSPMDMLRTGVVLNAIRDVALNDQSSDAPNENNFIQLLEWKNKVMSGILMGYDTYVQMGISDYFDNWLNFLQNIDKTQNAKKSQEFIEELINSKVISSIVSSDNQSLLQNYNARNRDKLLKRIAKNASDIKKLLDLYSDVEANAYDVLVNNFKGDPEAYWKIKSLLIGLTKAKFSEESIFSDPLPSLLNKESFYNLKGFNKLYDIADKGDKKAIRDAILEVENSYKELLPEGTDFKDLKEKFDEYVFDIITSDKLQEHIYKITNPTAFNQEAEKAAKKTEDVVNERTVKAKSNEIVSALQKAPSMESDSEVIRLLFEMGGKGSEFNPEIIKSFPEDDEGIKNKFGVANNHLKKLIREAKKYINLLTDVKQLIEDPNTTAEERTALIGEDGISELLSENGEFTNIHKKYANLFDRYYTLYTLSNSSVELDSEQQVMLNVLGKLWQSQELIKYFEENTVQQKINSPYSFFTYENKPKQSDSSQNQTDFATKANTIKRIFDTEKTKFKYFEDEESFNINIDDTEKLIGIIQFDDFMEPVVEATLTNDNKWTFKYSNSASDDYKINFEQFCNKLISLAVNDNVVKQSTTNNQPQTEQTQQTGQGEAPQPVQQPEPRIINVYDDSDNVIKGVTIQPEYIDVLKHLAKDTPNVDEARRIVEEVFPDKNRVDSVIRFLSSLLVKTENSEDNKQFHIVIGNKLNATNLKYNVLKFEKDAVINNVTIDDKIFDIKITSVDDKGNITGIETASGEPKSFRGKEYTVRYSDGQYFAPSIDNYKPEPKDFENSEEGSQFPVTQADYEDENKQPAKYKSTKVTNNSAKVKQNKPLYDYIRNILEENDSYMSMVRRDTNEVFENNVDSTLYFDYVDPNNNSGIDGIKDLIGIWSSNDSASRKLLGIIDPVSDAHILKQIKESDKSLTDITGKITKIITSKANVILEQDGKKNSLDKLDPNNDCLYVIKGDSSFYSNKSSRSDKIIASSELEDLLGAKVDDLQSGRVYIFTPTRVTYRTSTGEEKTRHYTKSHTSVEMDGLSSAGIDLIPLSIVEGTKEFAQKYLEGKVSPGSDDLHNVSNLFYSTQKNFNIRISEGEQGQPLLVASVQENDSDKTFYKPIDTTSVDTISNNIIQAAIDANVVLPYRPSELFIENNKRFNELKPYLFTTKAFVGESNIYFKYVLNKEQAEQPKPKEEDSNYTEPANEVELKGEDTAPTEAPKTSNDSIDAIFNRAVPGLSNIAIKQLIIGDIKSEKQKIDSSRKKLLITSIRDIDNTLSQNDAIEIVKNIEKELKAELITEDDTKNAVEC